MDRAPDVQAVVGFERPVIDCEGRTRWRVKVARNEVTCTGCGEVFCADQSCTRCAFDEQGRRLDFAPAVVPTLSYLRDGEWEEV